MSAGERAQKYIFKTERVFAHLEIVNRPVSIDVDNVERVVDEAKRYFKDAKYYWERKEYEVSLASIAYCEGLLDALRMLGLAKFEW